MSAQTVPFVGRRRELDELQAWLDEVRAGRPQVVLVEGPAGIGKTSLVARFLEEVEDARVLQVSGDESEALVALGVADQLLRRGGSGGDHLLHAGDHVAAGLEILTLLGGEGEDAAAVIVVDDAHWADEPSLRALLFAARRLVAESVLLVLVTREDPPDRLPEGLRRLAAAVLRVGPLGAGELGELASAIDVTLTAGAARRLVAHTGGNPLHARALLDELPPEAWEDRERPLPAPHSYAELIAARLRACSPEAQALVEAAAVLGMRSPLGTASALARTGPPGEPAPPGVVTDALARTGPPGEPAPPGVVTDALARTGPPGEPAPPGVVTDALARTGPPGEPAPPGVVTDALARTGPPGEPAPPGVVTDALADAGDPLEALDEAAAAGLLVWDGRTLAFPHPLTRAAVYHALGPGARARLHRAAGALLPDEAAALRHRIAATPATDRALAAEAEAFAGREAARGAWASAVASLRDASRLSDTRAERERRMLDAVDATLYAGDGEAGRRLAEETRGFAPGPRRDSVLAYLAIYADDGERAERLLRRAWAGCDGAAEPALAATIAQRSAFLAVNRLRGGEALEWARRALELTPGDRKTDAIAMTFVAVGLGLLGRRAEAHAALDACLARTEAREGGSGFPVKAIKAAFALGDDDLAGARAGFAAAASAAQRHGSLVIAAQSYAGLAQVAFAAGAWHDAEVHAERAVSLAAETGETWVQAFARWSALLVPCARGELGAAATHARALHRRASGFERIAEVTALAHAEFAAARGEPERVLRELAPLAPAGVPLADGSGRGAPAGVPLADGSGRGAPAGVPLADGSGRGAPAGVPLADGSGRGAPAGVPLADGSGRGAPAGVPLADGSGRGAPAGVPLADGSGRGAPAGVPLADVPGGAPARATSPPGGFWRWQHLYAGALVDLQRLEEADVFLRGQAGRWSGSMVARLDRVRGRLEAAAGRPAAAEAAFAAALERIAPLAMPYEQARIELCYGAFLRRERRRRDATAQLGAARERLAALGALPALERCDRELAACGRPPVKRRGAGPVPLTPQERAVARLVASGLGNRAVATELLVSVRTVEAHLTRIYAKLGIRSRAELIARGPAGT